MIEFGEWFTDVVPWCCLRDGVMKHVLAGLLLSAAALSHAALNLNSVDKLREWMDGELGVTFMQKYIDEQTTYEIDEENPKDLAEELVFVIQKKFQDRSDAVRKLKEVVEENLDDFKESTNLRQCCKLTEPFPYVDTFKAEVSVTSACVRASAYRSRTVLFPPPAVLHQFQDNHAEYRQQLTWQFLALESGITVSFPAAKTPHCDFDARYRPWYIETVAPHPKDIVLVLDASGSMGNLDMNSGTRLIDIAKETSKTFLNSLSARDRVGVVAFSTYASTAPRRLEACLSEQLAWASSAIKALLSAFIDALHVSGASQYQRAMYKAYQLLNNTPTDAEFPQREKLIVFVSDGASTTSSTVLPLMQDVQENLFHRRITVMTYALATVEPAGVELMQNMSTVASDKPGKYHPVTNEKIIRDTVSEHYREYNQHNVPFISLPYYDPFTKELVVTVTLAVHDSAGHRVGVVGTDFPLLATLEQHESPVVRRCAGSYAFVTNSHGEVLAHPLVPCSGIAHNIPVHVNIRNLQPAGKTTARQSCVNFSIDAVSSRDHMVHAAESRREFSLCVVLKYNESVVVRARYPSPQNLSFLYHDFARMDYPHTCRHFSCTATKAKSVIKFEAQAFLNPQRYLDVTEDRDTVLQYSQELQDPDTASILTVASQHAVHVTSPVESVWLAGADKQQREQFSNWRYIAMATGVTRLYPGTALPKVADATVRPWYIASRQKPGRMTLVGPYLDDFGSGYVVTASTALQAKDRQRDILGVMGLDMSINLLHVKILQTYPVCQQPQNRCFLIDEDGYIISHPDFVTLYGLENPVASNVHITTKEVSVAQHMISAGLLTKHHCLDFCNSRHNFYYKVDLASQHASYSSAELTYDIFHINNTNSFLLIKHPEPGSPWCPCAQESVSWGLPECTEDFMNITCSCPCYSQATTGACALLNANDREQVCRPGQHDGQEEQPRASVDLSALELLPLCWEVECQSLTTDMDCLQHSECNWCVLDRHGQKLAAPFCSKQHDCYFGQMGFRSPYTFFRSEGAVETELEGHLITLIVLLSFFCIGVMAVFARWVKTCICPKVHTYEDEESNSDIVDVHGNSSAESQSSAEFHHNTDYISSEFIHNDPTQDSTHDAMHDSPQDPRFHSPPTHRSPSPTHPGQVMTADEELLTSRSIIRKMAATGSRGSVDRQSSLIKSSASIMSSARKSSASIMSSARKSSVDQSSRSTILEEKSLPESKSESKSGSKSESKSESRASISRLAEMWEERNIVATERKTLRDSDD